MAERVEPGPSDGWVLASLSLCMLLPSLGTSIANVALPTLTEAFGAPFQHVQWVVLAYLLATTTSVGRVAGDLRGYRAPGRAGPCARAALPARRSARVVVRSVRR